MARRRPRQQALKLRRRGRGGARRGAGRKPKGKKAGVSHLSRPDLASRFPVHVTQRLVGGLPSLRWRRYRVVVEEALAAGADRGDFRITDWSNQANHLHLICEAKDKKALTRGLQGLFIRIAKALNRLRGRRGRVFADRYFAVILRSPRQVRHALVYVLNNGRKHGRRYRPDSADPCSSGVWFEGWKVPVARLEPSGEDPPVAAPRTWLRREGWRQHGLIDPAERPRT